MGSHRSAKMEAANLVRAGTSRVLKENVWILFVEGPAT